MQIALILIHFLFQRITKTTIRKLLTGNRIIFQSFFFSEENLPITFAEPPRSQPHKARATHAFKFMGILVVTLSRHAREQAERDISRDERGYSHARLVR